MAKSFNKFNKDNIKLIVALQNADSKVDSKHCVRDLFKKFENENIYIFDDTSIAPHLSARASKNCSLGYTNQQIAKLSFAFSDIAEHYLCVDSDTIFIKDFQKSDFLFDEKTPYIVLMQDKNLLRRIMRDLARFGQQKSREFGKRLG